MQLAGDKTAATPARVLAFLTILSQYSRAAEPAGRTFGRLASVSLGSYCRMGAAADDLPYRTDLGLGTSSRKAAVAQAQAVAADGSENAVVRGLARCVSAIMVVGAPPPGRS
jgi:hypothetical protein